MLNLLLACTASPDAADPSSDTGQGDTVDDTGGDSGGDTGGDTDTGSAALQALSGLRGTATVGAAYAGEETRYVIADRGEGEPLCQLAYALTSTATREDCEGAGAACDWAFDLVVSGATVEAEAEPGCAAFGLEVAALEGSTVGYGFVADYHGHTSVLMVDIAGAWTATSFADFAGGAFSYDWELGLVDY